MFAGKTLLITGGTGSFGNAVLSRFLDTDVREIRIDEAGVRFRIGEDDIWLFAPPEEGRVAPIEVMNFDRYEPEETRIMDLLSEGANQILDVGANIGFGLPAEGRAQRVAELLEHEHPGPLAKHHATAIAVERTTPAGGVVVSDGDRLGATLVFSLIAHGVLALGLGFSPKFGAGEDSFAAMQRLIDRIDPGYRA